MRRTTYVRSAPTLWAHRLSRISVARPSEYTRRLACPTSLEQPVPRTSASWATSGITYASTGVGFGVELVQHMLGSSRPPKGTNCGAILWARTGGKVVNPNAFRILMNA